MLLSWRDRFLPLLHLELKLLFLLLWLVVALCIQVFVVVVPLHLVIGVRFIGTLLPLLLVALVVVALVELVAICSHFPIVVLVALCHLRIGIGLCNAHLLLHNIFWKLIRCSLITCSCAKLSWNPFIF